MFIKDFSDITIGKNVLLFRSQCCKSTTGLNCLQNQVQILKPSEQILPTLNCAISVTSTINAFKILTILCLEKPFSEISYADTSQQIFKSINFFQGFFSHGDINSIEKVFFYATTVKLNSQNNCTKLFFLQIQGEASVVASCFVERLHFWFSEKSY